MDKILESLINGLNSEKLFEGGVFKAPSAGDPRVVAKREREDVIHREMKKIKGMSGLFKETYDIIKNNAGKVGVKTFDFAVEPYGMQFRFIAKGSHHRGEDDIECVAKIDAEELEGWVLSIEDAYTGDPVYDNEETFTFEEAASVFKKFFSNKKEIKKLGWD